MKRSSRYAVLVLVLLSVLAFYMMFVFDIDLGWAGGLALLAGAWLIWYLLWKTLGDAASAAQGDDAVVMMSPGEQRAWVGVVFTAAILIYCSLRGPQMIAADGGMAPEASRIGRHIVFLISIWVIVMAMLRKRWHDAVEQDERDHIIQARACNWARWGLSAFVIGVAVLFAFSPPDHLQWARPMAISNLMTSGLIGASLLEYLVTGVAYWRTRH